MAILVIEDETDCREGLTELLELSGYEAVGASSGQEAMRLIAAESFDLILCDVTMPGITGYNVIDEVKRVRELSTPFVFITAKATDVDMLVGMKLGANDYIVKPYQLQRVLEVVRKFVRE